MYIHTYIYTHIYIYTYYIYIYIHMHTYYIYIYIYTHTHTHIYIYIYIHVDMNIVHMLIVYQKVFCKLFKKKKKKKKNHFRLRIRTMNNSVDKHLKYIIRAFRSAIISKGIENFSFLFFCTHCNQQITYALTTTTSTSDSLRDISR